METLDDPRPLAAADDDDRILTADTLPRSTVISSSDDPRLLGYALSRFLILNSPELPYWSEGPKANWLHLPRDVLATILLKLGAIEIIESAQYVCTLWRSVCMDPSLWTHIDMRKLDDDIDMPYDLDKMCRHAITRSRGGCVDINIKNFCDDDLLNYIIERGCKLRRLRLECCLCVSDEGMADAALRLSFLETFEYCKGNLGENALKAIGKNCPRLTTLLYEQDSCEPHNRGEDDEAFAIAKYMPGLRCLSLLGNKLTNKGLWAILDGCPHLESLNLRQCFNVDLTGDLAKKCERIKDLKRPWDSTLSNDDYKDYYSDSDYISRFDNEEDNYSDSNLDYISEFDYDYKDYYSYSHSD